MGDESVKPVLKVGFYCSLICVALLAATPLVTSFWLEKHYQSLLNRLNISSNISLEVVQFKRGWLHSNATVRVTLKNLWLPLNQNTFDPSNAKPLTLMVKQRIQNGPLVFKTLANGHHQPLIAKALIENTSLHRRIPFKATLLIKLNNRVRASLHAMQLHLPHQEGALSVKNLNAHFSFDPTNQVLRGNLNLDHAKTTQENIASEAAYSTTISAKQVNSDLVLHQHHGLWYGVRNTTIGKLKLSTEGGDEAKARNTRCSIETTEQAQKTRITIQLHADRVAVNNLSFNPLNLELAIKDLDSKTLAHLVEMIDDINAPITALHQQQTSKLYTQLLSIAGKGFSIDLANWTMGTPQGLFFAQGQLNIPSQEDVTNLFLLSRQMTGKLQAEIPAYWLQVALTDFYDHYPLPGAPEVNAPETLAKQAIQQWIKENKLSAEGDQLKLSAAYQDGQLSINGTPQPQRITASSAEKQKETDKENAH